jgi:hypothetical protein
VQEQQESKPIRSSGRTQALANKQDGDKKQDADKPSLGAANGSKPFRNSAHGTMADLADLAVTKSNSSKTADSSKANTQSSQEGEVNPFNVFKKISVHQSLFTFSRLSFTPISNRRCL